MISVSRRLHLEDSDRPWEVLGWFPGGFLPRGSTRAISCPSATRPLGVQSRQLRWGAQRVGPVAPTPPAAGALPPAPAQPPVRGASSTPAWALLLPTQGCGVLGPHTHHLFCSAPSPPPGATGRPARSSRHVCKSLSIRCAGRRAGVEDGATGQDTVGSRKTLTLPQRGGCGAAPSPCLRCAGVSPHLRAVYPLAGGLSPAAARGCAVRARVCVSTCVHIPVPVSTRVRVPGSTTADRAVPLLPFLHYARPPPPAQPPPLRVWGEQGSNRLGGSRKSGLTLALGSTSPEKLRAGTLSSNCP